MISRDTHDSDEGIPSYLGKLTRKPLLTSDEEVRLTTRAQAGDAKARMHIIESNMRLVINIAKSYRSRLVPLEDLIQEGAIGLMYAVERYDPSKGFRFSTYATHWIKQAIGRAIDSKSKAIRIPSHISQTIRRIERERARLRHENGSEPTLEQLAASLRLAPQRLADLIQASQDLVSLDMRVGDSENTTLVNLLRDDRADNAESDVIGREALSELHHILLELNERERRVMTHRLKVESATDEAESTESLSQELQLSRERIRQIEGQAMKKLRLMAQRRKLNDIMTS